MKNFKKMEQQGFSFCCFSCTPKSPELFLETALHTSCLPSFSTPAIFAGCHYLCQFCLVQKDNLVVSRSVDNAGAESNCCRHTDPFCSLESVLKQNCSDLSLPRYKVLTQTTESTHSCESLFQKKVSSLKTRIKVFAQTFFIHRQGGGTTLSSPPSHTKKAHCEGQASTHSSDPERLRAILYTHFLIHLLSFRFTLR